MTPFAFSPNQSVTPLTYTINETGQACLGAIPLSDLASQYGTPLYVMDGQTVREMARAYTQTLASVYPAEHLALFASKANLNMALCQVMAEEGMGLDVVSGGELYTALQAGFPKERIVFNGNNKSADELLLAIHEGIGRITVDNLDELKLLHELIVTNASAEEPLEPVSILLRVCPGIECHTHDYIKTGQEDTKFGLRMDELPVALNLLTADYAHTVALKGLHAHIGSQIFEERPYADLAKLMLTVYHNIRAHYGITFTDLNLGGGFGIAYTQSDDPVHIPHTLANISRHVVQQCQQFEYPLPRLLLEPGRSMVATAGLTLYTVGSQKQIPKIRHYVAVDGGMGDNIRPALYQAQYSAVVANKAKQPKTQTVTVAGKYCESGDVLIEKPKCPPLERGDTLCVFATGAYNYSMASTYNRVPRPAMVWVENNESRLMVRRETYADLMRHDMSFSGE